MNNFKKHKTNKTGRLLFSSEPDEKGNCCEVYEYVPGAEELHYYKNSQKEPLSFVKELMEYRSKEEQLFATDNMMKLVRLTEKIHTRIENEKKNKTKKRSSK